MKNSSIPFIYATLLLLSLSSCASLLNGPYNHITIVTDVPNLLIVHRDTINYLSETKRITVPRSADSLEITAISENRSKTVAVPAHNSTAYWVNIYFNYGIGMLVDRKNPKRYTYPSRIYLPLNAPSDSFPTGRRDGRKLPYATVRPREFPSPFESIDELLSGMVKIRPLTLLGTINPGVEISYERWTGHLLSTQVTVSWLLPNGLWDTEDVKPNRKGYRLAVEEKLYYLQTAPVGPYMAFEINYLRNDYQSEWMFGVASPKYNPEDMVRRNYPDTFGIKKETVSFNLKWGLQKIYNRFTIDVYMGLGLKYRNVRHYDRRRPTDEMESPRHPNIHYISDRENKNLAVSLPVNFSVGWVF